MIESFPPVTIEAARLGKPMNICSVTQAAEFLLMKWPIYDGPKLKIARQLCFEGRIVECFHDYTILRPVPDAARRR